VRRAWFLALPVLTVLVVAYSLLVAGAARAITAARVYGGPTEGVSRLALRVECVTRDGERETAAWPGAVTVRARTRTGAVVTATASRAIDGVAEVELSLPEANRGALSLELESGQDPHLASGSVALTREQWKARAHRRGGWIRGRALGDLTLSIAPERGVFVVGSKDPLWVRVERDGKPVAGAHLTVRGDGATSDSAASRTTDASGRARFDYSPTDLNPLVHIEANTDDGAHGLIESGVTVVPGGFHAQRTASGFRVEISVPRAQAFYSLVTEDERVTGGVLALEPDGHGGAFGVAALANVPHPAWLVVSSEVDLNSMAAIGWPLDSGGEPAHTFDVADSLLLNGLPAAFAREQARRTHVRWLTTSFVALALALSVLLLVQRVRSAERDIARHLRENLPAESVPEIAPRRGLALLVAVLAVALGFVLLALIAASRAS